MQNLKSVKSTVAAGPIGGWRAVGGLLWLLLLSCAHGQQANPGPLTLGWNPSASPSVAGYYVYYGGAPGYYTNKSDAGANTNLAVSGLVAGCTYYFTATAYNSASNESSFASEVSFQVPGPALAVNLSASAITYGQPLSASPITGTVTNTTGVVIPGSFAYATPAALLTAGTYSEMAVFVPAGTNNFGLVTGSVSVTVLPAPLVITANCPGKTYGQTLAFGSGSAWFSASGLQNGDTIGTVTLVDGNHGGLATAPVGGSPYPLAPSAATGGTFAAVNYTISYVIGNLTVSPAMIMVASNPQSRSYGTANPALTASYSGFVNADSAAVINGAPVLSASLTSSSPVGTYAITTGRGTLSAANYGFALVNGTLSVTPASLTITALNESKTYGQALGFTNGSTLFASAGLQNGETVGSVSLTVTNNGGAATATVAASPYTITSSAATGGTFAAGNYSINYVRGSLKVNPAPLTISAVNQSKTYGQTLALGGGSALFSASGLKNGEVIGTITLAAGGNGGSATATVVHGQYTLTPSAATGGTFVAGNYAITYALGALTVDPAPLAISAASQDKTYGQTRVFGSGSTLFATSGLQNGQTIGSVTLTDPNSGGVATASVAGSPYPLTLAAATGGTIAAANYTITYIPGALTVNPATLTITALNQCKLYGQAVVFGSLSNLYSINGLQHGETIGTVTEADPDNGGAATATVAGSPYPLTPGAATGGTFAAGNYTQVDVNGTLTVNPAPLSVTALNQSKTYGQTVAFGGGSGSFATTGLQNGETIGTISLADPNNGGAPAATVAGSPYTLTPGMASGGTFAPGNYNVTYVNSKLAVSPAALTITAASQSKLYGQTVVFTNGSTLFASAGLQNGETVGTVTLADPTSGGTATATVTGSPYPLTPGAATGGTFAPGNYTIAYVTGALSVNPAALNITVLNATKLYGQTVGFGSMTNLYSTSGLQNGETVGTVTVADPGNGGAATATVAGSPYPLTPGAATGGTFAAGNYTQVDVNGTLTVNPAPLSVTALNQSKTYGQTLVFTNGCTLFASSGLQNGETIGAVSLAVTNNGGAAMASVGGSPYTTTPSAATGGTFVTGNYSITYGTGTLTVNPAPLTVTALNQSKTYGQTLVFGSWSNSVSISGLQNGQTIGTVTLTDPNLGGTATASVASSPYPLTPGGATGGTFATSNYTLAYVNGTLTVNPAPLTVRTFNQTKSYGQTMVLGGGSTLFTVSSLQNGESIGTVTLAVTNNGGTATGSVAGAPYLITPSGATGGTFTPGNYAITYVPAALNVTPVPLTITALNQSRSYGHGVAFGSGSTMFASSGLLNGETIGTVSLSVTNNGSATSASVAGSPYLITPSGATGGTFALRNYTISYGPGSLVVTPASLTITAASQSKTYGQTFPFTNGTKLFTSSSLQNGESIATVSLAVANNGGAALASVSGSPCTITPSAASGGTFVTGNYSITYGTGVLTINPAPLTISTINQSKSYGQALVFGDGSSLFTPTGLQNGETISTVTLADPNNGGAATAMAAASYPLTPTAATGGTFAPGNYAINYVPGTLTVTPVSLTITALHQSRSYGQGVVFGSGSTMFASSGLLNGETIGSVSLSVTNNGSATSAPVAGSPYLITPSGATGGSFAARNYTISYGPGSLVVTPAALTITAASQSKTYGQILVFTNGSKSFTSVGLQNGEAIGTVTLADPNSGGAATASVAGSPYPLTPGAAVGGTFATNNYTLAYVNGTLTVKPAPLTVTAVNESKPYGQTVVFTNGCTLFTATGLLSGDTIGTVTLADPNNGGAATATVAATYPLLPSAATGGTFAASNYTLAYVNGTLTVTPVSMLVRLGTIVTTTRVTIHNPVRRDDGTIQLTFTGAKSGVAYQVQGSTDLQNWTTLTNQVAGPNGLAAFIDASATNHARRFYRTVAP